MIKKVMRDTPFFLRRILNGQKELHRINFLMMDLFARSGSEVAVEDLAEVFCLAEGAGYPSLLRDDLAMVLFEFYSAAVDVDTPSQTIKALRADLNIHLDYFFTYLSPEILMLVTAMRSEKAAGKDENRENALAADAIVGVVSSVLH